jgi:hypothetical protein
VSHACNGVHARNTFGIELLDPLHQKVAPANAPFDCGLVEGEQRHEELAHRGDAASTTRGRVEACQVMSSTAGMLQTDGLVPCHHTPAVPLDPHRACMWSSE